MSNKINCTVTFSIPTISTNPQNNQFESTSSSSTQSSQAAQSAENNNLSETDTRHATIADVFAIVKLLLSGINVYVLESDITDAQNSTKRTIQQIIF